MRARRAAVSRSLRLCKRPGICVGHADRRIGGPQHDARDDRIDRVEIGGVVAFISGIGRITDPWGDLVNYFRDINITQVKFALVRDAVNDQTPEPAPNNA